MARFTGSSGGGSGAPGPQGPAGQDGVTPFTISGAYDNGASYNLGIAVYYNGGTYVRTGNPLNPGYPPTPGSINESWTPIADKGDAGEPGNANTGNFIFNNDQVTTNGDMSIGVMGVPGSVSLSAYNGVNLSFAQTEGAGLKFPDNTIQTTAYTGGGGTADLGDFVFTAGTATVNDDETLVIQSNNSTTVKSQLTLSPFGTAKLEAFDSPDVTTFYSSSPDWDSATWAVEPGVGSVINFVNAPNILNWISSSTLSVYNASMIINGIPAGTVNGFSYNGTDITLYINNTVPTEDPTVNEIGFSFAVSSRIDIDYDNGSFDLVSNNMDIRLTSDDDIYITAGGDDLFLRANDDIRFVARYNEPGLTEQQWTMNSEGELHFPGDGYIANPINSSGDGYGNDTLELIPDQDLSVDQRIIIDPTSPNHIHIRAGGPQDNSQAYLILGGERTHVQVSDQQGDVRIKTKLSDITYSLQNVNPESSNLLVVDGEFAFDWNWFVYYNGTKYSANGYYTQNGQTFITQYDIPFETGGYYLFGYTRGENDWNFSSDGSLYGPGESSVVKVTGIENATDSNSLSVTSSGSMTVNAAGGDMNFYMDGGMYIGASDSNNQIIKRSDLNSLPSSYFQSVRWTPNFEATGLTFTGTDTTHPAYQSYYVKQGQLVSFWIAVDLATVTNFGTGQLKLSLPFDPLPGTMNHFSGWVNVDETQNPDLAGHIIVNADHLPNTSVIDLHYIKQSGGANSPVMEAMLMQNTPVVLTTNTNIYVNGTYISA